MIFDYGTLTRTISDYQVTIGHICPISANQLHLPPYTTPDKNIVVVDKLDIFSICLRQAPISGHLCALVFLQKRAHMIIIKTLKVLACPIATPVVHHHDLHVEGVIAGEAALDGRLQKPTPVVRWNDDGYVRLH